MSSISEVLTPLCALSDPVEECLRASVFTWAVICFFTCRDQCHCLIYSNFCSPLLCLLAFFLSYLLRAAVGKGEASETKAEFTERTREINRQRLGKGRCRLNKNLYTVERNCSRLIKETTTVFQCQGQEECDCQRTAEVNESRNSKLNKKLRRRERERHNEQHDQKKRSTW